MNNRKFWLNFFIGLIIFQIVLALAPPVLAQEIQKLAFGSPILSTEIKNAVVDNQNFNTNTVSPVMSPPDNFKINDSLFKVVDEYKDEADIGNGKRALKIYSSPRPIFIDNRGVKKVRPAEWNKFNENSISKINKSKDSGYNFGMPFSGNKKVDITAGNLEKRKANKQINTIVPVRASLSQKLNKDKHFVSSFNNVYESVNINFIDKQTSRTKEIVITKQPTDIDSDTELIFWENYSVPRGAKIMTGDSEYSVETRTFSPTSITVDNKESVLIDSSIIFDSKESNDSYRDMSQAPVEQIVIFDQVKLILRIGLVIKGDYLLDKNRVYPVIVDPSYYTCTGTGCVTDFYLKWLTGKSTQTDNSLFMGYDYANGVSPCTPSGEASRHAVFKFNVGAIPIGSTVTDAKLNLKYTGIGCGEYNSYVSLQPKQITTSWTYSGITYNGIRPYLTAGGYATSLSYSNLASDCPSSTCTWSLYNSMVQSWIDNPSSNNGFLVEPSENFSSGSVPPFSWSSKQRLFKFYSSDYNSANSPYLYVTYTPPAPSKPDLTDIGSTINTNPVIAGQSFATTFRIQNSSSAVGTGQSSILKYYFNPIGNCYSTTNLAGQITVPALSANGISVQTVSYTVPSGSVAGDYCFYYKIDANNIIDESNESNNNLYFTITVNVPSKPDLTQSGYSLTKYNLAPGETVNSNLSVINQGNAAAGATQVNYYFDKDGCNYSNYVGQASLGSLSAGYSANLNFNYSIPSSALLGTYYLGFSIDAPGNVNESNENNNKGCFNAISVSGKPDFTPSNFTITNTQTRYFDLANTIGVNGHLQNLGNAGYSGIPYLLRLKNISTGVAYDLTNLSPSSLNLPAGYDGNLFLVGTVPSSMPVNGNYTIEVIVDPVNDISESNENNNITVTNNSVAVQQYYVGGGGGGGSSSGTNSDADSYTDKEEVFAGTNANGAQSMNLYAPDYKTKKAIIADKPKNNVVASASNSDAISSINAGLIFGNPSYAADPVNIRTGAFEFNQTDFVLSGRGLPINFARTYNSKLSDIDNRIGNGWNDSYNIFYYQDPTTKNIQLYLGGSMATLFTTNDSGNTFVAPHGEFETLTKENGNLVYRLLNGVKYIFSLQLTNNLGVLKQIADANGNVVNLTYDTVRNIPLLTSVSDASNRQINFIYPVDTDPLWNKFYEVRENIDGNNRLIARYTYDTVGNLIKVHQESNYTVEVVKNIDHLFAYDSSGRMLTYTDPRGTILYNEYDSTGRVIKQWEHNPRLGAGDKRMVYELAYTDSADASVPGSAHCTLVKNYRDMSNHYDEYACYNSDELKVYGKKGNNVEKWEYNIDGMVIKYTNAIGNAADYTYDTKRRLISHAQSDTADWRTLYTFEYENNFNRLIKKTETVIALTGKTPPAPKITIYTIDPANGNTTAIKYPDGISESFQYDNYGNIKKHINKNNQVSDYVYDSNNNYLISDTVSVIQADNIAQTIKKQYGYNAYGYRISYTDPNGKIYVYGYDTRGNLRIETDPLSNGTYYKYDLEDHKISETDALGHEIQYEYDTDLNASLLSVTKLSASGNIINSRQYDYVGNIIKETDGNGNIKTYSYTAENWLFTVVDAKRIVTNEYYANGLLKKQTDSEDRRTDYFYDSRGNKTEIRAYYDLSNYISNKFVYDGFNRVIAQIDGKNNTTNFAYDAMDRLVIKTDPKGGAYSYFYDAVGNKIGERTPLASADSSLRNSYGYSTYYMYDAANRLIKQINTDDKVTLYIYDANGNIIKIITNQNNNGTQNTHITQFTYFDNNWKKFEIDAYSGTTEYAYYGNGTVKTKKSPVGLNTIYTYDDFNRLTTETDNAGLATNYAYDNNNNKKSVTFSDTTKTQYTYNSLNLLETVKDALNGLHQFEYDGVGNKIKDINKLGKATNFVYDKLNRLVSETNAVGTVTSYTYDNNNNRTTETVGAKTTSYGYDELNRNTQITYPGNKSESATYDANGNIAIKTDGKGQKITYTYDKLNRQATKLLPGGFTVQYTYDNWNNLTNLTDESGIAQYTYDNLNRNINETKVFTGLTGKNYTVVRAYNADGQLSAVTDTANRKFDYAYNTRGLLDNVKYATTTLAKYTYSNFGKPNLVEYGNGVKTNLNYDNLNRITDISAISGTTTLFSQKYTYDAQSNRIALNDGTDSTTAYTYDGLEQLTNVNIDNNGNKSSLTYNYDIYGNRTAQTNPLSSASYTYTAGTNELDKVVYNNRLTIANNFDNNGSLIKETYTKLGKADKDVTYTWDTQNRLAQINYHYSNRPAYLPPVPDNTLNFTYDDFGNRTKKQTTNGSATYYFNSGNVVLNEIGNTGVTTKSIAYGLSPIAEIDQNNTITYLHQDSLGSAVLTTDQTGNVITKYEYDPFGQIIGQDGKRNTNYLYTGQEYDLESDLYYYNARYYNSRLGRFISRDPMLGRDGDSLSRNGFAYVKNNPLKYIDPSGEEEYGACKVKPELYWSKAPKTFSDYVGDAAGFFNYVKDYNYKNPGDNWLFKGMAYGGGFLSGMIGNTLGNVSTVSDPYADRWKKGEAGLWLAADIYAFGGGSIAENGAKEVAVETAPKVLEMIQPQMKTVFQNGKFAGEPVIDIITKLKNEIISSKDVVIGYVERNGRNIVLNNKSFSAIKAAEVTPVVRDFTGVKWAEKLTTRLLKQNPDIVYDFLNIFK